MRKVLICALALGGFAASAQAADLSVDSLKDPLPEVSAIFTGPTTLPDKLSLGGVTLYGTVDVGYAYLTNGAPLSSYQPSGYAYTFPGFKMSRQGEYGFSDSGMEQSKIGVKVEEEIGYGFAAIGKLDTGFDPLSGNLSDGCQAMVRDNGLLPMNQATGGDTSRCGQDLNGVAYGGVSSATYGTLTYGRQQNLMLDALATYDPLASPTPSRCLASPARRQAVSRKLPVGTTLSNTSISMVRFMPRLCIPKAAAERLCSTALTV